MSETQAVNWEERYRGGTTGWERHALNPQFVAWRNDGELQPCRILIPGAGRSPEPLALAAAGFAVTIVDAAQTAIAAQKARLDRLEVPATVEFGDLFAWEPADALDAIYDQTCLCALPPALWADYARRLHRWLRPGGKLFALFMQTGSAGGPPFHCDIATMSQLFPAPDWSWPDTLPPPVEHTPGRTEQPAVLIRN